MQGEEKNMQFPDNFFEDEVREGFYIGGMVKRCWAAQLVVLHEFDQVCRQLGLTWFAAYGTLLGAIRDKGYIPWDDDIDIWMKRKDYEKLIRNVHLLPANFYFLEGRIRREGKLKYNQAFGRLINAKDFMPDAAFLQKYQGFPYPSGLDIFILDRLAPTEQEEKTRTEIMQYLWYVMQHLDMKKPELERALVNLEKCTGYRIDRSDDLHYQLLLLFEHLNCQFEDAGGTDLASMDDWASMPGRFFPEAWFASAVEVPFENTVMQVPVGYHEILTKIWGDYMTPVQAASSHVYPCFRISEEGMEAAGDELPYKYYFHPGDLDSPRKAERKGVLKQALLQLEHAHKEVLSLGQSLTDAQGRPEERKMPSGAAEKKDPRRTLLLMRQKGTDILGKAQDRALHLEKILLTGYPDEQQTAGAISDYYTTLYHLFRLCQNADKTDPEQTIEPLPVIHELQNDFLKICELMQKQVIEPKEIVFIPFKADGWKYMEPLYRQCAGQQGVRVFVTPIPYYRRNCWFDLEKKPVYEGDRLAGRVPISPYQNMILSVHTPDVVVTQNPYDACGIGFSADPHFYSDELRKYAGKTVYLPWFRTDEVVPEHDAAWCSVGTYINMPGVLHADRILVPSENMREVYIRNLTEFAGEKTRKHWEETVITDCQIL